MMKLKIEIECNNAAFDPEPAQEIAIILKRFVYNLENEYIDLPYQGSLRDSNGNTVGTVEVK